MKRILILLAAALLLIGCGKPYQAKSVIKDFLKENLAEKSFSANRFSDLDSTRNIEPQRIIEMHREAASAKAFRKDIQYPAIGKKQTLMFMRMQLRAGADTLHCTFYLDRDLQRVVAFKYH